MTGLKDLFQGGMEGARQACPWAANGGAVSRARPGAGRLDQQLTREMQWALIWGGMLMVMAPL